MKQVLQIIAQNLSLQRLYTTYKIQLEIAEQHSSNLNTSLNTVKKPSVLDRLNGSLNHEQSKVSPKPLENTSTPEEQMQTETEPCKSQT